MRCLFWQGLVLVSYMTIYANYKNFNPLLLMTYQQVVLLLVLQAECGRWRNTSSRKNKARKAIILCCGRKRCLDFVAKKRIFSVGTTSNGTINNNNHLGISSTPKTQKVATSTSIADISATATLEMTTAALDLTTSATAG
jgi:hypothetical protein